MLHADLNSEKFLMLNQYIDSTFEHLWENIYICLFRENYHFCKNVIDNFRYTRIEDCGHNEDDH